MKKLIYTLSAFVLLALSTPAIAQQQINNDGASSGDLQQSVGSSSVQSMSGSAQQTDSITNNAGATTIQNAPNQPLTVSGAPASSDKSEPSSKLKWIITAGVIFIVLLSPALLYVRDLQKNGEVKDDILMMKAEKPKKTTNEPKAKEVTAKDEPDKLSQSQPKKKSSKKKANVNKAKRGKKKKK